MTTLINAPHTYALKDEVANLVPSHFTDVGQAKVVASVYRDRLLYSEATSWMVFDGQRWSENEPAARGLVHAVAEKQLEQARSMVLAEDEATLRARERRNESSSSPRASDGMAKRYHAHACKYLNSSRVSATLTEATPYLQIPVDALDADGYLLNTPGGTVDLRTGTMKPHDPADLCTKITAIAPDTVNADLFAAFMERVTVGDKDLERYLQEVAGMCAVGRVLQENLIIAYGEGGNGKSTLFNLLAHVLGDYSGSLSAETLTANCRKNKSPEYAELRGKRLVIAAELEEGMRLDTAVVKKLCSTDPIKAEKKFKAPFDFIPSHSTVLYTNHLPKVGTNDKGTWDRLVVVPFLANFRGMKGEVKNYADHLFEHCGGAVLTWIIEGARRFITDDYNIVLPDCVKKAISFGIPKADAIKMASETPAKLLGIKKGKIKVGYDADFVV
ncbi:MAG: amidohydrolase family protein, partial [Clostridia bacterium]|nr:amidohydrolase family protein [Clostridia bacterium]